MKKIIFMLGLSYLTACRVTESRLAGNYFRKKAAKTTLTLQENGRFYFILQNFNPDMLPLKHADANFFFTTGRWSVVNQRVRLESLADSAELPSITIQTKENSSPGYSIFTFFDSYGDSVRIGYVQYSDKSIRAMIHRSMPSFKEDISKRDTLTFYCHGYKPWTFVSGQKINQDYQVTLVPEYQPRCFKNDEFEVKGGVLVNDYLHLQFKKRQD